MSHLKRKPLLRIGYLAGMTWLLAACTGGGTQVRTEDVTSPATSASIALSTTLSSTTESIPPTTTDLSPPPSTSASGPPQWPSTFSAAQIAASQASLVAVTGLTLVTENADAAPASKDWAVDINQFAGGSAAQQTLASIKSLVDAKVHATAPQTYDNLTVISADDNQVVIEACADSTKLTLIDANGQSVFTPPANPRVIETFRLYVPVTGGWLVDETSVSDPERPC